MDFSQLHLRGQIEAWLKEDIGSGDLTTDFIIPVEAKSSAVIHAKQDGVLAGIKVAQMVFETLSSGIIFKPFEKDGASLKRGTVIAEIEGSARAILTGERLALNLLQRMSGVATKTRQFVQMVAGTKARIVDTRKTTPGLRMLEKYAVVSGGGFNHRLGLYDAVLIKDNHIKVAGGVKEAVEKAKQRAGHTVKIEVEVESLEQVELALSAGPDIIMLDNMDFEMMRRAVEKIGGKAIVEASGGVNENTVRKVAETGVDIISVGALTHSAAALDVSLDIGHIKV